MRNDVHKARAQFLTSYKKRRVRGRKGRGRKSKKEGERRGGRRGRGKKTGRRGKYLLNAQVNVGSARGRQNHYVLCRFLGPQ